MGLQGKQCEWSELHAFSKAIRAVQNGDILSSNQWIQAAQCECEQPPILLSVARKESL